METWVNIVGSHYDISDLGNVRSNKTGKLIQAHAVSCKKSYRKVGLYLYGERVSVFVHQLVAWNFVGSPPDNCQIHHVNGIATDNRACNLRYENTQDHQKYHCEKRRELKVSC
jgi:hypothetical protein